MAKTRLDRSVNVGYIYAVYRVGFANQSPALRARSAGTRFLVGNGLVATNRHLPNLGTGRRSRKRWSVAGALSTLEGLVILFPGSETPIKLHPASNLEDCGSSHTAHREVGRSASVASGEGSRPYRATGYANRISTGNCRNDCKGTDSCVYERLTYRGNEISLARELAALSLVRPSVTYGHLSEVSLTNSMFGPNGAGSKWRLTSRVRCKFSQAVSSVIRANGRRLLTRKPD
jgi:hypothetical protein